MWTGLQPQTAEGLESLNPFSRILMLLVKSVEGYVWGTFSWHGSDSLHQLDSEVNANIHKAIMSDHGHCVRIDEPDRGPVQLTQRFLWQHLQQLFPLPSIQAITRRRITSTTFHTLVESKPRGRSWCLVVYNFLFEVLVDFGKNTQVLHGPRSSSSLIIVKESKGESLFTCLTVNFSHKINLHSSAFLQ